MMRGEYKGDTTLYLMSYELKGRVPFKSPRRNGPRGSKRGRCRAGHSTSVRYAAGVVAGTSTLLALAPSAGCARD